ERGYGGGRSRRLVRATVGGAFGGRCGRGQLRDDCARAALGLFRQSEARAGDEYLLRDDAHRRGAGLFDGRTFRRSRTTELATYTVPCRAAGIADGARSLRDIRAEARGDG